MNIDRFVDRMNVLIRRAGSAAALARMAGVSESVVRKWRDGTSEPSREHCVAIAKADGCSVAWLVAGEGPERMDGLESAMQGRSQAVRLDVGRLRSAVRLLEMALDLAGREMVPADKADLVVDLYGWLADHGDALTPDNVVDLNQYLSVRLKAKA